LLFNGTGSSRTVKKSSSSNDNKTAPLLNRGRCRGLLIIEAEAEATCVMAQSWSNWESEKLAQPGELKAQKTAPQKIMIAAKINAFSPVLL